LVVQFVESTCRLIYENGNFEGMLIIDPSRFDRVLFLTLKVPRRVKVGAEEEWFELVSEDLIYTYTQINAGLFVNVKSLGRFIIEKCDANEYVKDNLKSLRKESLKISGLSAVVNRKKVTFDSNRGEWMQANVSSAEMNGTDNIGEFNQYITNGVVDRTIALLGRTN
jgi:hypothetical protein